MWGGSNIPPSWLLCDGSAISRTTYALLFAVIGTTYGTGNGSTTFNVPNLQGKMPLGYSSSYSIGSSGGSASTTLEAKHLPSHNHTYDKVNSSSNETTLTESHIPAHTHGSKTLTGSLNAYTYNNDGCDGIVSKSQYANNASVASGSGMTWTHYTIAATHTHTSYGGGKGHSHTIGTNSTNTGSVGSGTSFTNLPPYLVVKYIIFTGI